MMYGDSDGTRKGCANRLTGRFREQNTAPFRLKFSITGMIFSNERITAEQL